MQPGEAWLVGKVLTAVGGVGVAAGARLYWQHRRYVGRLRAVEGRVVEVEPHDCDGQTMFRPIVEYSVDGRTHRVTDGTSHGRPSWAVGDAHDVLYDPDAPATAQLGEDTGLRFGAELFGGAGAVLLVAGLTLVAGAALGLQP